MAVLTRCDDLSMILIDPEGLRDVHTSLSLRRGGSFWQSGEKISADFLLACFKKGKFGQEDDQHTVSWAGGVGADRHRLLILVLHATHSQSVREQNDIILEACHGAGPMFAV